MEVEDLWGNMLVLGLRAYNLVPQSAYSMAHYLVLQSEMSGSSMETTTDSSMESSMDVRMASSRVGLTGLWRGTTTEHSSGHR